MSKIRRVSTYPFLFLTLLCYLWNVPPLVAGKKSSDNAIAKLTGARNEDESIWMKVVADNTSASGWAIDMLRNVAQDFTDAHFHVYMYAMEKNRPTFRHYFFRSILCPLVSKKTRHPKLSFDHFIPTQIMKMILPGRQNSCRFTKGKRAIKSEAHVNADRNDPKNKDVGIPYSFPFDLMVNVVRVGDDYNPVNHFNFQVNFTVDRIGSSSSEQGSGANGILENATDVPLQVPARVIGVKNGMENAFFTAVENKSSPTGWNIKVNKRLRDRIIDYDLLLNLYAIEPTSDTSIRQIFHGFFCDTMYPYNFSRFNGYPDKNYLPRQIVDFIFPGHQGSCDFESETHAINSNGTVDLNPYDNPDVELPHSPYYNLIANIRSKKYLNESNDVYFFQVNFTIGDSAGTINGVSHQECQGTKWNSKIIYTACKGYELVTQGVSKVGNKIASNLSAKFQL